MRESRGRGRPRATSQEVLEEAAIELFLEQGYEGTTVDDIAKRAGISRSAFFAYFPSKADVLWLEIDHAIARVAPREGATVREVAESVVLALEPWGSSVPWALRDADIMGTVETLQSTVIARLEGVVARLAAAIGDSDPVAKGRAWLVAASLVSTTSGAISVWARMGRDRGPASEFVRAALARIVAVYRDAPAEEDEARRA